MTKKDDLYGIKKPKAEKVGIFLGKIGFLYIFISILFFIAAKINLIKLSYTSFLWILIPLILVISSITKND